jgi:hypothetical protein
MYYQQIKCDNENAALKCWGSLKPDKGIREKDKN